MATNTIKVKCAYADGTERTYSLVGVTTQDLNPTTLEAKINAYNSEWGLKIPTTAPKAEITGYEEYVRAMKEIFISSDGAELVSLVSATTVSEEEVLIFNG